MPKQLITVIGLILSLGVIALGISAVALPMYIQSVSVDAQTAAVASNNDLYQAQVHQLRTEEARLQEIEGSVGALRRQIPATNQLDDVFELVAQSATATDVIIRSVTAGAAVDFVVRTGPTDSGELAPPAGLPATDEDAATGDTPVSPDSVVGTGLGRQQVDFAILVSAPDMAQATAFLDALRGGPRLLSGIKATTTQSGEGVELQLSALTFVDSQG